MMAVWSRISTSGLVGAIRLDAEFWQPAYLEKEKAIRVGQHIALGALVSSFKKGIFYILAREYTQRGIPFYRSSNVGTILPKDDGITFITPEKQKAENKTALGAGDLMIVKTGRSGASVVMVPECNVSQDVIAVKVRRERVNPYYLAVYLNTSFGCSEMNRWFQGQVQPHLSLEDARRIWVALVPDRAQEEIESAIKASAQLKTDADEAHANAKLVLEAELGLDNVIFQKPVGYTAQFSEAQKSLRVDSEHFYPEFEYIVSRIPKEKQFATLGKDLVFCQRGKQPTYGSSGLIVINSKHVQINQLVFDGNRIALRNAVADFNIRQNDLLMNGTGVGTIGRAAVYLADSEAVPDNHVTILRTRTLDPVYLSVFLNSRCGQSQVRKHQRGSSGQLELYPHDIAKFFIWHAPMSIQLEIRGLIERAHEAQRRSQQLLAQAKTRVEQLIEEAARS